MGPAAIVELIMSIFLALYIGFEVYLNLNDQPGDTSNILLLKLSKGRFFFIPFVLGAIGGHLFLGTYNPEIKLPGDGMIPVIGLFVLAAIMLGIGFWISFKKPKWFLTLLLVLGFAYGHFFWSMNNVI